MLDAQPGTVVAQAMPDIWSLADTENFAELLGRLSASGVREEELGEALLACARQAIAGQRLATGRRLLEFLESALEEEAERPAIRKMIGDILRLEGEHVAARQWYGRLPATRENIRLCLETFLPERDVAGMLACRDQLLARMAPEAQRVVHGLVDGMMARILEDPEVREAHAARFAANRDLLPRLTLADDPVLRQLLAEEEAGARRPGLVRIGGEVFERRGNAWERLAPVGAAQARKQRQDMGKGENLATRCGSARDLALLLAALATEDPEFFKFELYVVLPAGLLVDAMRTWDLGPLAECDFVVRLVCGERLDAQLRYWFCDRGMVFPARYVAMPDDTGFGSLLNAALTRCEQQVLPRMEADRRLLAELYPQDFADTVKEKIRRREKLRVLLMTSRYTTYLQYSTRDMAKGFRQLGHETFVLIEDEGAGCGIRRDVMMRRFCEFRPDIVFCINHLRYEYDWIPKSIPFVTWVQDPMESVFGVKEGDVGKNDFVYSSFLGELCGVSRLERNPVLRKRCIGYLPFLVNHEIYRPVESDYLYDVSYVGHCCLPKEFFFIFSGEKLRIDNERQLLFSLFLEYTRQYSVPELVRAITIQDADSSFWDNFVSSVGYSKLFCECHSQFMVDCLTVILRSRLLQALVDSGIDVALFGRGWEQHPWFADLARGPVPNGASLNRIYNTSKVNLNLNIHGSQHQKFGEVCAGENFCLTIRPDERAEGSIFAGIPGYEGHDAMIPYFADERDLVDKVRYYVADNAVRRKLAVSMGAAVLERCALDKGAAMVIQDVAARLG